QAAFRSNAAQLIPSFACTNAAVEGSGRSGVHVATISRSTALGSQSAEASARVAASTESVEVVSPGPAKRLVWMPVRSMIHSSEVSTSDSKNSLGTTRWGRADPTDAMRANRSLLIARL